MNKINTIEIEPYGAFKKFELLFEEDNKRLVHRIADTFDDYCIDNCQIVNGEKRWGPDFWNPSKSKMIRRWMFDRNTHKFDKN